MSSTLLVINPNSLTGVTHSIAATANVQFRDAPVRLTYATLDGAPPGIATQRDADRAAVLVADAVHELDTTAGWLAVLLAVAVVAPPILLAVAPWLFLRLRFFRRKWTVTALAATPAGQQLLALRALANRSPGRLAAVSADPVAGWRHEDPYTIRALAALELRAAGIRLHRERSVT